MPVEYYADSDGSDFSETDMSLRGRKGRTSFHRRSISRHHHPEVKESFLAPVQSSRVYRSASTGGRRPRERDVTPAVMIVNEQAQRTNNSNSRDNKPRRVQQRMNIENDSDDELVQSSSRRRAVSGVAREASPYHRDYDLVLGQRFLEKSDARQDLEIWKQQQEIDRLQAELRKHREKSEYPRDSRELRLLQEEDDWYEEEISERLRRLQRFEKKYRSDEEKKRAEHQWRLKKFEEAEKEAANREELKAKLKEEKLKEIARQQEEEEERERMKKLIIAEEQRKAIEAEEKKKKEIAMKAAAVEEWKLEQERAKQKEKEEKELKDKEFRERLRREFGYSEEEIEEMLKKKNEKGKDKQKKAIEEGSSTTWIKVCSDTCRDDAI